MDAGSETGDGGEVSGPRSTGSAASRESDGQTAERGDTGPESTTRRKPAVTRRDPVDDDETKPGVVAPSEPPEPQRIDTENAAFVLLGVVLVIGFLVVAVAGL